MSNTTHKLTAQMVAAYPNAMVQVINQEGNFDVFSIQIKQDGITIVQNYDDGTSENVTYDCRHFQLVLTSPDKITDAQALEVAKEYYKEINKLASKRAVRRLINKYFSVAPPYINSVYANKLSDICRAENIDMGYRNIPSLISAGLAVEKEVCNQNKEIGCPFDEQL